MTDTAEHVTDPLCGMAFDPWDAAAQEVHDGRRFYFCSQACHNAFLADPHRYGHPEEGRGGGHHGRVTY